MDSGAVRIKTRTLAADMYYKNTLVLRYKINYPWFESSVFTTLKINQHYAAKAIAYQQYCETSLYQSAAEEYDISITNEYPARVFEAVVNYNVTYNRDCTLSLYFDRYEYTGGAHGMTVRYSDTWDLQDGHRLELGAIYPAYASEITGIITADIAAEMQSGEGWYFEDYAKNVAEYFNPEHFYLTGAGLVVYFQLYEIAPYASGIPEFTIPYSDKVHRPRCK
jgi:hypothetical protein